MILPDTYIGPGLVDLQVNGFAGFDFNSDPAEWALKDWHSVRDRLHRRGILVALPTFITDDHQRMLARARRFTGILEEDPTLRTTFPLLHIEGPFISAEDGPRGAHPIEHCSTPATLPDFLRELQDASSDRIGILTLAPELDGAIPLITSAAEADICVAIGHTAATPAQLKAAVHAGARMSTHLGNGSHQALPRLDNYVQAQLADDDLEASFIADGHHMPYTTLKNFIRAKHELRSILVSDAVSPADVGPGRYQLGGEEIVVSEDLRVSKPGQANLAGSALTLDQAVVNATLFCDVLFERAWEMASTHPARVIGIPAPPEVTVSVSARGFDRLS